MSSSNHCGVSVIFGFSGGVSVMELNRWLKKKKEKKWVKLSLTISTHRSQQSQTHCHCNPPKPAITNPLPLQPTKASKATEANNHKPKNFNNIYIPAEPQTSIEKPQTWKRPTTTTKKPKNFNKIYIPTKPQTQKWPRNHNPSPTTTNLRLKEMRTVVAASIHPPIAIWIMATQSLHIDLPSWFEA